MSDREQLGLPERARTAPAPRRQPSREPWRALSALGNKLNRTSAALADLARLHNSPASIAAQEKIATAVMHELLAATDEVWRNGVAHGKWLNEQQVHDAQDVINKLAPVQHELWELTSRYSDLQSKYAAAKEQTVRDIA